MIDAEQRKEPRFPGYKESSVREEIKKQLRQEKTAEDKLTGIAGGACGGDILFHELCIELEIPSEIFLALPIDEFRKASVSFAGIEWEQRFETLIKNLPVHILADKKDNSKTGNIWEEANLWMLNTALANGGKNMSLLALWDGKGGDGSGGTEHMIKVAKEQGAKTKIIDINQL